MRTKLLAGLAFAALVAAAGYLHLSARATAAEDKDKAGPALVHNVFFTLKESNAENRKKLVAACNKYLTKHEGEVYYAAGPIAEEFKRELNDKDFDVCLTIVFKDTKCHDTYQGHKRHLDFIAECKDMWKQVRVFDSFVEK